MLELGVDVIITVTVQAKNIDTAELLLSSKLRAMTVLKPYNGRQCSQ